MSSDDKNLVPENTSALEEIIAIIERGRENAFQAVNRELISMYWEIGRYISKKVIIENWGKSVVQEFSRLIQSHFVGIKGFSPQNLWRMKQFYETYSGNEKLSPLVREISWTNNVLIMTAAKTDEEREFYLLLSAKKQTKMCAKNNYSKRELERQIDSSLYERTMISAEKNQLFLTRNTALNVLRDSYVLEFLGIPEHHKEKELRKAIITNLRDFILEFGKDFTLVA